MHGFYRIAAICPKMNVADVSWNKEEIIRCSLNAEQEGAEILLFPELSLTGCTCGDLLFQPCLLNEAAAAVLEIAKAFAHTNLILTLGLPVRINTQLYDCAVLIQRGKICGLTPKTILPNRRDAYEKRYFCSGEKILQNNLVIPFPGTDEPVPVTALYTVNPELTIGVELGEDLESPNPPSSSLAMSGANVILNLSAESAQIARTAYRRSLMTTQSARCMAVYASASAGVWESTTDAVFSGRLLIAENGTVLAENKGFQRESEALYADIDAARLVQQRISEGDFASNPVPASATLKNVNGIDKLKHRMVSPAPFIPETKENEEAVCREIFQIQCAGLAKRMESAGAARAVLGLSGGLDSTLALLVVAETFKMLGKPASDILTLTMPGFGTTDRTKSNAEKMAELLGTELRTVEIKQACLQHFKDIGHDPEKLDVTFENTQARERTQILMDMANRERGLVIGTGDLSEIALGWCTYNADHMSMYDVNCGITKTMVRHIVSWYAEHAEGSLAQVLKDVVNTPVSPELLPADKEGQIAQKTEKILGSYDLHDFFLYHFFKYGATPEKMLFLAEYAFCNMFTMKEIHSALQVFIKRFFTQQFKRSCSPDGPKIGSISLSPRGAWRMPSDASFKLWMDQL